MTVNITEPLNMHNQPISNFGSIYSSSIPAVNDGYNVGSPTFRWHDGYFAHVIDVASKIQITSDGYIFADDGNHPATPSYSFLGDTDTGVYSSAANTLDFSTGGTRKATLTNDGYLGLGTGSPTHQLQVMNDGYIAKQLEFGMATLNYNSNTIINFSSTTYQSISLAGDITFSTSNLAVGRSVNLRIISDGSIRNLTFPGSWIFLGDIAPTNINSSKTAVLSLTSWSTADSGVIAGYGVQQ